MSERASSDSKKAGRNSIVSAFFGAITMALVGWLRPSAIPYGAFDFWSMRDSVGDWLLTAWPAFAWGGGITALIAFTTRNKRETNRDAEAIMIGGTIISLWAGVMEEICFRRAHLPVDDLLGEGRELHPARFHGLGHPAAPVPADLPPGRRLHDPARAPRPPLRPPRLGRSAAETTNDAGVDLGGLHDAQGNA